MKSWKRNEFGAPVVPKGTNNLVIVDGLNFAFRYDSGRPFSSEYVSALQSLSRSYGGKDTIVLTDRGKSIFRTNLLPEYKAHREAKRAEQTPEQKAAEAQFFEYYKDAWALCENTFHTFACKGVEADDMAAYIVKLIGHHYDNVWLISTDGDWDTLLSPTVHRFSFKTAREYKVEDMYDNHGCDTVEQFISLKALQGDLGDNIRGVEGVGVKRGYSLLREYGTAANIADSIPLPGKQKFIQNVNASEHIINRNIQLVDLPGYCAEAIAAAGYLDELTEKLLEIVSEK